MNRSTNSPFLQKVILLLLCCLLPLVHLGAQEVLLNETFESADALSAWTVETGVEGRVEIVETGDGHWLRMDDSAINSVFSQNSISRSVDIAGLSRFSLSFDFNRLDDEWHSASDGFDGVSIRVDGQLVKRYYAEGFLQGHNEYDLDAYIGLDASTLEISFHQYDNMGVPYDGLEWDNIVLSAYETRAIFLEPTYLISEADQVLDVLVVLDPVPVEDITLSLVTSTGAVVGEAIFPAGQAAAELQFPVDFDNSTLSGDQTIKLRVFDGSFYSDDFSLTVTDDETAALEVFLQETVLEGESATVSVYGRNLNRYQRITVLLESSHPDIISVPSSVSVYASYSSTTGGVGTFTINPVYNPAVTGDQDVTITARYGEESVSEATSVVDINTLHPLINLSSGSLSEGSEDASFVVYFNAAFDESVEVSLEVDDPSVTLSQDTITILPEPGTGQFSLSIEEDDEQQGSRVFNITATAHFAAGDYISTEPYTILDNDVAAFVCELPDMLQRDASFTLDITAVDADGSLLQAYEETVSIILEESISGDTVLLTDTLNFSGGAFVGSIEVPAGAVGDKLILEEPDGTQYELGQVILYGEVQFSANSLTYDSDRELFYAVSGGQALPGHLHSVTPIDPATLNIGDGIYLGGSPSVSTLTPDNSYLYIGKRDSYEVSRLNLATLNVDQVFTLTSSSSWDDDSFWPEQILTFPGEPTRIVVVQDDTSSTYAAVHSYTNGIIDSGYASHDEMSLVNGADPDIFFAYNYSDTGYNFRKYQLTASGIVSLEDKDGVISGFSTRIYGENDWLFTNTGLVIDGSKMEQVGEISFPWSYTGSPYYQRASAVEVDLDRSRLYFAKDNELLIYEAQGYTLIRKIEIPVSGDIIQIERYGESGLAISTDAGEILFAESSIIVPTGDPTDLAVTIEATPKPAQLGEHVTFTGTVTNVGDVDAIAVNLVLDFNDGISVEGGTETASGGTQVTISLGDMAPGATHDFTYVGTPTKLTTLVGRAVASTFSLDENYADNQDSVIFNVGFASSPNSVNVIELECNDAIYDDISGLVVVTTQAEAHDGIANKVLGIDPYTGLVERSVSLPGEGGAISLSDDSTVLYILNTSHSLAYRIDWINEVHNNTVTFPDMYVDDLEILSGTTDSIVIGSGWEGVRVYDNGILRPSTSGTYNGDQVELLPDPSLIFGYNTEHTGFESFKFEITETGVQTLVENGGLFSGFYKTLKSDGYYVFDSNGVVVRADLMSVAGNINTTYVGGTGAFEPERDRQRAYYASGDTIGSYDTESYLFVRRLDYDMLPSSIATLERWGDDGFVSVLENGYMAIIRTELIPPVANTIDLIVDLEGGEIFTESSITVTGSAFTGQGVEQVAVNGVSSTTSDAFANWSATIDLQDGENTITVVADPFGTGAPRSLVYVVYHGESARIQENLEVSQWFESETGQALNFDEMHSHDHDGDGLSELAEYLFGTDPARSGESIVVMDTDEEAGEMICSFVHRASSTYTYTIQTSLDMIGWDATHSRVTLIGEAEPLDNKPGYAKTSFKVNDGGMGQCFIKITVE